MVIVSAPIEEESPVRRPVKTPRRRQRNPTDGLNRCPQTPNTIDSQLGLSNPWDSMNPPTTPSRRRPSFSNEPPRTPVSSSFFSPISIKEECVSPYTYTTPPCLKNASISPLKRKFKDDYDGTDYKSILRRGFNNISPYQESHGSSQTTSPMWTPSTSPEPSECDVFSRRPSLSFAAQDPIMDGLNRLRMERNKEPLPPLEGLCSSPGYPTPWTNPRHVRSRPSRQSSPTPEVKKRRAKSKKTAHCNIKYLVEELDYIRYQRVDCEYKWARVESSFQAMFPMTAFPLPRETQGLQGVCYRQNKLLPRIVNDQLVFMLNGHVELVCVKTRYQAEKKHLYTLIYLFPERAMNYPWVSSFDRERARELNERRQ